MGWVGCSDLEMMMATIPRIDPKVSHVGSSKLRDFNNATLGSLDKIYVIQDNADKPLAVLLPYDWFLELQNTTQGE